MPSMERRKAVLKVVENSPATSEKGKHKAPTEETGDHFFENVWHLFAHGLRPYAEVLYIDPKSGKTHSVRGRVQTMDDAHMRIKWGTTINKKDGTIVPRENVVSGGSFWFQKD